MEDLKDWNKFAESGKVEDYLEFTNTRNRSQQSVGDEDAGFFERDGDGLKDGTYR